jgi:Flp pilus assembly protein TadG
MNWRCDRLHGDEHPAHVACVPGHPAAELIKGDKGSVAVVFAVLGSMMIASLCVALDTIDAGMAHSRMQSALDVATLSAGADLAHYSSNTGANLAQWQADALAYYNANMPASYLDLTMPASNFSATVTGSPAAGQTIALSASGNLPLIAPVFLGSASGGGSSTGTPVISDDPTISANNEALFLPKSTLELTMVLDNTGSMSDPANGKSGPSKMAGLQSAATNLVQAIYSQNGATSYVGLVPFASTVNVLNALPSGGSWMNPSFAYNPANVAMKASGTVAGWGGCVVEPRDANGFLYPSVYAPSSTLKFTPYYYNLPAAGLQIRTYSRNLCSTSVTTTTASSVPFTLRSGGSVNYCSGFLSNVRGTGLGAFYDQTNNGGNGTALKQNSDCITRPVTFLTTDQTALNNAISQMTPGGSTIIPVGLLWGWRMLSSSWSSNIAGGGNGWVSSDPSLPKPETTQGLQRVMIVLTDGENQIGAAGSIPNDLYFNGLSGVGTRSLAAPTVLRTDGSNLSNGLTDSSELHGGSPADPSSGNNAGYPDDVNTFQSAVCTAIKQSGVTIYAITFGSASSSSVAQQVMQNCATPGDYYHAPDNTTLNAIFQQIAGHLGVLRLIQ